jgi:AraC-like DNA-binding protein
VVSFIRTLGAAYDHGHEIGDHDHGWGQLVYASSGAIHVVAAGQTWLIPPARAVWLPPDTRHRLRMRGATRLRTLYIPPAHCGGLAPGPLGLDVSPLLRELIMEIVRIGHVDLGDQYHRAVGEALLVMLARAVGSPLALTLPTDRRALRVAQAILAGPGNGEPLDEVALRCGASLRTIQRKFQDETGMPLSEWRQTARLMEAAALLLDGKSVTEAALEAGYSGVSAFIHAFRGKLGQTPSAFRQAAAVV